MTRDVAGIVTDKWADNGDRIDPDDSSLSPPLNREEGWDISYSQIGGNVPRREVWNQLMRELFGFIVDSNKYGSIAEWSQHIDYVHTAFTMRSGKLYVSLESSGPSTSDSTDPVQSNNAKWTLY